jgi:Cu/Ag efflux protein CusF
VRIHLFALILAAGLLFPPAGYAAADNSAQPAAGSKPAAAESKPGESGRKMTAGVVKKVNKETGKVTISHEPIEHLEMPKMTMVFRVKDPAMLDRLMEGDRIDFVADKVDGVFTLMRFEPSKPTRR